MPDITDVIIILFFGYLGYKYLLPIIMEYGWIILFMFIMISAVVGFAIAFANYAVAMVDNMTKADDTTK